MSTIKHAGYIFFTLMGLAGLGTYFAQQTSIPLLDEHALSLTQDAVVTGIMLSQFDVDGTLKHRIESMHMRHIPKDDHFILDNPHMTVYQKGQLRWTMEASFGDAYHQASKILLTQHVMIEQPKTATQEAGHFTTESLTYFPKRHIATTHLPVRLTQPGRTIEGVGMTAYTADNRVEWHHDFHATYVPIHA